MNKTLTIFFAIFFLYGMVFSQTVNICGRVTDPSGKPLTHTVVRLSQTTYNNGYLPNAPYLVSTDSNGFYHIGTGDCSVNIMPKLSLTKGERFSCPVYMFGKIMFSLRDNNSLVKINIYDLSGKLIREIMNKTLSKGNYSISIDTRGMSSQFYLVKISINNTLYVLRLQPKTQLQGSNILASSQEFKTRLEKLADIVDTLRATEPGYTLGITPISSLIGQCDFVLSKNNTWNGDLAAFWGDTSKYPKTGTMQYVILNRTNGAWPDSKIYWSHEMNGQKIPLSQQSIRQAVSERFYLWIAPTDSGNKYFDFLEVNAANGWLGNTTRVDGWRLPIAYWVHTSTGQNYIRGDYYEMFYQTRQAKFEEFKNEVPKEFIGLATHDFANIWAPHTSPVNYFNNNGPYVNYFNAYEDTVRAHNPGAPASVNAWNVFACAGGGMGSSPVYSAALNRHVAHLPPGTNYINWNKTDTAYYYQGSPCNYFSKWVHRRSLYNLAYGFPYDDVGEHSSFIGASNVQWIAVAIGW